MTHTSLLHPTILDGASLFDACDVLAQRFGRTKITLDYGRLRTRLDTVRRTLGWHPASSSTIIMAVDPTSDGQQRFQTMLRHAGYEPDVLHFRDAFVSLPPGRAPSDVTGRPVTSLASRIAYIAGLMARHNKPECLVVTHAFELFGPLSDLARRIRGGGVGVAYFGSLMDYRWKATGLLDGKGSQSGNIAFADLDEYGEELLGIDLAGTAELSAPPQNGLSKF